MNQILFNVVAIKLAEAIYHARSEAYGIAIPAFDTLPPREKQDYIDHAADVLEAVKPLPAVPSPDYFAVAATLTRRHALHIIGRG